MEGERCEQDPHTRGLGKEPLSRAPPAPTQVLGAGLRDSARVPVGGQRLATRERLEFTLTPPRLPNAISERISGEDWGPLPPNHAPAAALSLARVGPGPPLPACVPESEPRLPAKFTRLPRSERGAELRTQRRAEPAWGTRGKGLSPKRGAQGAGKSPPRPRGGADTALDVSPRPPATDEPAALRRRGTPRSRVYPHAGRRAPPPSARPGCGRSPARRAAPALCPSRPAPPSPRSGAGGTRSHAPGPLAGARRAHSPSAWCRDGAGRARRRGREATGRERRSASGEGRAAPARTRLRRGWRAGGPAARGGAGRRLPGGWVPAPAPSRVPGSGTSRSGGLRPRSRRPHLPRAAAPFSFSRSRPIRRGGGPRGHPSAGRRLELNVGTLRGPSLRSKRDWWRTEVRVRPTLKVLLYCPLGGRMPTSVPSPL